MVQPVFPKVGLSKNCPMLNVYGVVPRVRRINRSNKLTVIRAISDRKVASSMPVMGINANSLTDVLCGVEIKSNLL